jgi:hypothetical protein
MGQIWKHWKWVVVGALITPVAVWLAVMSGGAGHGDYVSAKLLFPYSMLLTRSAGDSITSPLIGLALAQFPAYGLVGTVLASRPHRALAIVALSALHAAGVALCFSGLLPNFS